MATNNSPQNIYYLGNKDVPSTINYKQNEQTAKLFIVKKLSNGEIENIVNNAKENKLVWINYDWLTINAIKDNISQLNNLLDNGFSITVIKDEITVKDVVKLLSLNTEAMEVTQIGEKVIIQAIKVEKFHDQYVFTGISMDEKNIGDQNARYHSLIFGTIA
jgi:hypothetical protein